MPIPTFRIAIEFVRAVGLAFLLAICACNTTPPRVESSREVAHVRATAPSVGARFLPDSDIPSLSRLRQLDWLDFTHGWGGGPAPITDEGVRQISEMDLPRLEWLQFGFCENITDVGPTLHWANGYGVLAESDGQPADHRCRITTTLEYGESKVPGLARVFYGITRSGIGDLGPKNGLAGTYVRRLWERDDRSRCTVAGKTSKCTGRKGQRRMAANVR